MNEMSNSETIRAWSNAPREIIEQFGDEGDIARQYLLNPAIFSLLGDVSGKNILDAGCGQGYLSRLLAKRGAIVTGVEPATGLYEYAVRLEQAERLGISYLQQDLSLLDGFKQCFDFVVANMVFMDIPAYEKAMHNCIAALKRGGHLIFSILHPCFDEPQEGWDAKGYIEVREYFKERALPQSFGHFFHRPLSSYLNLVIHEGCSIQQVIEPQLDIATARLIGHERNVHVPNFIVVGAMKL
jgi:2-polyprenyl-3-methyl-5-hydroxy-6-metoxy-1,4-benzoquinol methylase